MRLLDVLNRFLLADAPKGRSSLDEAQSISVSTAIAPTNSSDTQKVSVFSGTWSIALLVRDRASAKTSVQILKLASI